MMRGNLPRRRVLSLHRAGMIGASLALMLAAAPAVLAAPPVHQPARNDSITFQPGEVCAHAMFFENTTLRARETDFAPRPDGSGRAHIAGMGVSRVTDLENGKVFDFKGGFQFTFTFEADGSMRVDGHGRDYLVWYMPGDNADLAPGLYQVNGTATEWYGPDGTFLRATHTGRATDVCAALGG